MSSLALLIVWGIKPGIDFTGGSILELEYSDSRPAGDEIAQKLTDLGLGLFTVQPVRERNVIIKAGQIGEETHQAVLNALKENQAFEEKRFESVGSVIGQELQQKTVMLILASLLAIVLYIALAFRRVQRPLHSWQYGIVCLFTLFHDIMIPLGVLAVLGKFYGIQVTIPIIAAILTILGYSINNAVVVFDRIRENLSKRVGNTFKETVNESINQILTRCLSTSLTTLLPLFAIFFWGGETLKYFALTLIIGLAAGFFSSIFLTSPILVYWSAWRRA